MYLSKPTLLCGLTFNCVKSQMKYIPLSAPRKWGIKMTPHLLAGILLLMVLTVLVSWGALLPIGPAPAHAQTTIWTGTLTAGTGTYSGASAVGVCLICNPSNFGRCPQQDSNMAGKPTPSVHSSVHPQEGCSAFRKIPGAHCTTRLHSR